MSDGAPARAPLRIMIVDDEPLACERLRGLLTELPGNDVAGTAHDGAQAIMLAARLKPDVLLLDVRMPVMDGLEVAQHLAELDEPPAVVFTTAYDEYAMQAFEAQAVGYLLKPVRKEKLAAALERARRLSRRQVKSLVEAEAADAAGAPPRRRTHVSARLRDELKLVRIADVFFFSADRKYTTVRHAGGTDLIEDTLRALEDELAPQFVRVHRNALVNSERITAVEREPEGQYVVRLRGIDDRLPVSRRMAAQLKDILAGE